jgi:formylglycine-generating enzyme required for sulfatase activity
MKFLIIIGLLNASSWFASPALPEMVQVPAGVVLVGSEDQDPDERPMHRVNVSAFMLGRTEVTVGQFRKFVEETGYSIAGGCKWYRDQKVVIDPFRHWTQPGFDQDEDQPVVCVNSADIEAYLSWLSIKTGITFRLPSEAEWEYAASAGDQGQYPWAEEASGCRTANISDLTRAAAHGRGTHNYGNPALYRSMEEQTLPCADGYVFTSPVGQFSANAFGLHDMIGNVWERVADCAKGGSNAVPPYPSYPDAKAVVEPDCTHSGIRGGSWHAGPRYSRISNRSSVETGARMYHLGFRVARDLTPKDMLPQSPSRP